MIDGLQAPRPIDASDTVHDFCSEKEVLDLWLQTRALKNEGKASRTYVVCRGARIAGYYSLAVGCVAREMALGAIRRNMPEPIPVMVLARLAVDKDFQGQGLGRALVKDAVLRTRQAASIAGIRAILVHALDDSAVAFYRHCGFLQSPLSPLTLMLAIEWSNVWIEPHCSQ